MLIATLGDSKVTSTGIGIRLAEAEVTETSITAARNKYDVLECSSLLPFVRSPRFHKLRHSRTLLYDLHLLCRSLKRPTLRAAVFLPCFVLLFFAIQTTMLHLSAPL